MNQSINFLKAADNVWQTPIPDFVMGGSYHS